jgi:hypothetical protein
MLVHAWRKHLPFSGPRIEKGTMDTVAGYKRRTSSSWGLIEWVADVCGSYRACAVSPRKRLLTDAKVAF